MAGRLAVNLILLLLATATTALADGISCEVKSVEDHIVVLDCKAKVNNQLRALDQVKLRVDYPPPPLPPFPGAICGPPYK